jgi:hypothetical protein
MRRLILIALFSLCFTFASAQTWEAGVFLGSSGYMGDISPVKPFMFTDLSFGGQFKRNFDGYWSAKLGFMQGKVQGNDAKSSNLYQRERNLNFYSSISEFSLQVEFNLFKYLPGELYGFGSRKFSPYLFTGIGYLTFNPLTKYNGTEIELITLQTEAVAYKNNAISIPYGAGVKYNIKGNLNLIGEIGYRTAFTDYLDDISGIYPDFTVVSPKSPISQQLSDRSVLPNIGIPGNQRGDYRPRDTYMFAGLSLTYTFVPIKCPTF